MSKKTITFTIQKKTESKYIPKNKDPFRELDTKESPFAKKKKFNATQTNSKKTDKQETTSKNQLEK